jgi:hypothetical protein
MATNIGRRQGKVSMSRTYKVLVSVLVQERRDVLSLWSRMHRFQFSLVGRALFSSVVGSDLQRHGCDWTVIIASVPIVREMCNDS